MKKVLPIIALFALLIPMAGCRSQKEAAATTATTSVTAPESTKKMVVSPVVQIMEQTEVVAEVEDTTKASKTTEVTDTTVVTTPEEPKWQNVQIPVKVTMVKPQRMTFSGTASLVRGEYVLISIRLFGFEIGQMHITPEVADMVLKQPSKVWIQTPVKEYMETYGVNFADVQDVMLGNKDALDKIPEEFTVAITGTDNYPEVSFSGKLKNKEIEMKFAWELNNAKWDQKSPREFTAPGSNYRKTTVTEVLKTLGGFSL